MTKDVNDMLFGESSSTSKAFIEAAMESPVFEHVKGELEKILEAVSLGDENSEKLLAATRVAMALSNTDFLPERFRNAVQQQERLEHHLINHQTGTKLITGPLYFMAMNMIFLQKKSGPNSGGNHNTP